MMIGLCLINFECFKLKSRFSLNKTAQVEFFVGLLNSDFIFSCLILGD